MNWIIGSDISNPETNELYESWNVSNFLYYLSTQGLNKDHEGIIDNTAYVEEIGNFPEKVLKNRTIYSRWETVFY